MLSRISHREGKFFRRRRLLMWRCNTARKLQFSLRNVKLWTACYPCGNLEGIIHKEREFLIQRAVTEVRVCRFGCDSWPLGRAGPAFHKCKSDTFSRCPPISIRGSRGTFNHTTEVRDELRFTSSSSDTTCPIPYFFILNLFFTCSPPTFHFISPPSTPRCHLPLCHFFTSLSVPSEAPL